MVMPLSSWSSGLWPMAIFFGDSGAMGTGSFYPIVIEP